MPRTLLFSVLALDLFLQVPTAIRAGEGRPGRLDRFGDPLPPGVLVRLGTVRFSRCDCAAYSPDGKLIVTGDRDGTHVWEAANGKKLRLLPAKNWGPAGLIFSHDGKRLAAVAWGGSAVQVWDVDTFKQVLVTQTEGGSGGGDWSGAAAFSSDDRTLVAATSTKLFRWDLTSGKKLQEFPLSVKDRLIHVRLLAISEDGKVAATRGEGKAHLWDTQTGKLLHELVVMRSGETMKFSRDGKTLVVPGVDHWMNLFSVATGKKIHSLRASERVVSLAFSPDGKTLAAASNVSMYSSSPHGDQVIQLWDLTNPQAPPVKYTAPGIHSVTFSPDGKTLAWGCHRQTLCFMDRASGKDQRPTPSHRGAIKSLVYHPDGKRLVSASEDGTIRIWDAARGDSLSVLRGHVGRIYGLALFPNGKVLASCGQDGTFRLWDVDSGKSLAVLNEGNYVVAAAFSADGKRLASGGDRGVIFMRHPGTGKVIEEFESHPIAGLAFSPDSKTLATLTDSQDKLFLQDLATKKAKELPVESGTSSVAYSLDGRFLAVGCDEALLLLDTATNHVLRRLRGHANRRGCVVFSPDSRYLASVSDGWGEHANRSIRVFELATGTEIHSFKRKLPIFAAAFSPDGSKLAVGGADATAVILDLNNLTGTKRRAQLTETELSAHWESLGAAYASKAYDARADLLHAPKSTVPFLAKRLHPAPVVDVGRVARLLKQLNSDTFRERNAAARELEQLGELVRASMRKVLADNPPLEMRKRLQALLNKLDQPTPSQLRYLRAIEILEGIGTPEALRIVERLTQGNPDGLATVASRTVLATREKKRAPLPDIPRAQERPIAESQPAPPPGPVLPDLHGDPMPAGAIARLGTTRWRLTSEPQRILVSADGKQLAVVNSFSGVEFLDAQTGRSIQRPRSGHFSLGFDLRSSLALSADWRTVAGLEAGERSGSVLAVFARGKTEKVKIEYGRKKESYPVVPEEVEASGSVSTITFEYLSAADFAPDGKTVVGAVRFHWQCSGNKGSRLVNESHLVAWNAATGKELWKALASTKEINSVMFSPDGNTVTAVDQEGVGFWDAATGRELRRWRSKDSLFSACYSPDRNWLATGTKAAVLLWEVATGKVRRRLAVPGEEIKAIAFSPDGKFLAGGGDRTIRFWDPRTGKVHGDCSTFPSPVEAVAFSSDGKTLLSGHKEEHVLRRWDVVNRKPFGEFSSPIAPVRMLSFSRDSRTILASSMGEDFQLWESATGKPCPVPRKDGERFLIDWLASSGQAALLRCENTLGAQFAMFLTGKVDRLDQVPGFLGSSVDGQRVLIQSEKEKMPCLTVLKAPRDKVKTQDRRKNDIEREIVWNDGEEVSAALSPDGKTVAAAGKGVVCFIDVLTGGERRYGHPTNVGPQFLFRTQSVKFSPDGSRIALVGSERKIRVLSVLDGRRLAEFATKSGGLTGLAFSPDGQTLLTTSFDARVDVWEVATGQRVRRLEPATCLYSPDNRMLAASAETLKVFDLYSGRVIRECNAGGSVFGNVAFSPNSKSLAASCSDTTILVWPTAAVEARSGKPLDEKHLAQLLETGSATAAYPAIGQMIGEPERALAFLERRLRPVPPLDGKRVQRLLGDLASDQSERRELATKELVRLGPLVEPALRATLSSPTMPLPSKGRIEKLLHDLDENQTAISADDVLHLRAVQALERIGTKRARQLLERLARGTAMSPRTRAAVEALSRMEAP